MQHLLTFFNQHLQLRPETTRAIEAQIKPLQLAKGDLLVQEDRYCREVFFLNQGSVKATYLHEGAPRTNWIYFEGELFTAWSGFMLQQPSSETLEALEPSEGFSLGYDQYYSLSTEYPDFGIFLLRYYENMLGIYDFLTKRSMTYSALEKYQFLSSHYPILFQRASGKDIASIMGITRETFSRVKAQALRNPGKNVM